METTKGRGTFVRKGTAGDAGERTVSPCSQHTARWAANGGWIDCFAITPPSIDVVIVVGEESDTSFVLP